MILQEINMTVLISGSDVYSPAGPASRSYLIRVTRLSQQQDEKTQIACCLPSHTWSYAFLILCAVFSCFEILWRVENSWDKCSLLLAPVHVERMELAWACDVTVTLGRISLATVLDHNGKTHPTKLAVGVEDPAKDNKPLNRFGGNESYCSAPIFPEFCSHSTYMVFIAPPWFCKDYYFYHSIKSSLSWGKIAVCETTSLIGKETVVK